jgi:sugar lactone lactonase YvrE
MGGPRHQQFLPRYEGGIALSGTPRIMARDSTGSPMKQASTVLAEGLSFGEGPRWHDGRLWLSDFYSHSVLSFGPGGDRRVELELDDQPSGLGWMPDGSLLVVGMTKRQVWRRHSNGMMMVHADLGHIAAGHCNDMVVDRTGRAYVGNFGFDLDLVIAQGRVAEVTADPPLADLAMVDPDGRVTRVATGLAFPNGTVITPDGATLIIAETFARRLSAFSIGVDGALTQRRVWADLGTRMPDGICLDEEGAIWVANPARAECVRIAGHGEVLDKVDTIEPCFAVMLGGADGRTLFVVTAPHEGTPDSRERRHGKLRSVGVEVRHAGFP